METVYFGAWLYYSRIAKASKMSWDKKKTVINICDNWNKLKEYVIQTRDGYKSMMGKDRLHVGHV
jgi:hypothetical protein